MVSIGPLPDDKQQQVCDLIMEFADIFALSVQEVKPVNFIKFRLNIPKNVEYPTKVNQQPLMQAQDAWYFLVLDDFVAAGVLQEIRPDEVKATHPTVLAQKAHGTPGLTMDEIKWIVKDKCIKLGEKPSTNMPPRPLPWESATASPLTKPKWQITQNFHSVNQVLRMAPMMQGDIHTKQQ